MSRARDPSPPPAPDPIEQVVTGYLIEKVRDVAVDHDEELFDQAVELYEAVERAHSEGAHAGEHHELVDNVAVRAALRLLGKRALHVYTSAVRIAHDNEVMVGALRERVRAARIRPATKAGRARALALYEEVLAETVPLEDSLDNVEVVAEAIELANTFLNPKGVVKKKAFQAAWAAARILLLRDEEVRERVEELREGLSGDPERLSAMAELVREVGPGVVAEAYRRGGADVPDVLPSGSIER